MPKEEAARRFIEMSDPILDGRGSSVEFERIALQQEYEACVKRKLAEGESIE
mgnify:CR=1 FL=1